MRARSTQQLCIAATATIGCLLHGCASGRNVEILETRLRTSQDRVYELEQTLAKSRTKAQTLQDDIVALREEAADNGQTIHYGPKPTGLAFSTLLTGGVNDDGQPGDEAVRAIIHPVSEDGTPIASDGRLEVELLDVSAPSDRRVRGSWSFTGKRLRDRWKSGLFSTGYELELAPETGDLPEGALLIARFITPDGQQHEATHTVKLNPAGEFPSATVKNVSASSDDLTKKELTANYPVTIPRRDSLGYERPEERADDPFGEFQKRPIQTSDAWTDVSIPTMR